MFLDNGQLLPVREDRDNCNRDSGILDLFILVVFVKPVEGGQSHFLYTLSPYYYSCMVPVQVKYTVIIVLMLLRYSTVKDRKLEKGPFLFLNDNCKKGDFEQNVVFQYFVDFTNISFWSVSNVSLVNNKVVLLDI